MAKTYTKNGLRIRTNDENLIPFARKLVGIYDKHMKGQAYKRILPDGTVIQIRRAGKNNINCEIHKPIKLPNPGFSTPIPEPEPFKYLKSGLCISTIGEWSAKTTGIFLLYNPYRGFFVEVELLFRDPLYTEILYSAYKHQTAVPHISDVSLKDHFAISTIRTASAGRLNNYITNGSYSLDYRNVFIGPHRLFSNEAVQGVTENGAVYLEPFLYKPSPTGKNVIGFFLVYKNEQLHFYKFVIKNTPYTQSEDDKYEIITNPDDIVLVTSIPFGVDQMPGDGVIIRTPNNMTASWMKSGGESGYLVARVNRRVKDFAFCETFEVFAVTVTLSGEDEFGIELEHQPDYQSFYSYNTDFDGNTMRVDADASYWTETNGGLASEFHLYKNDNLIISDYSFDRIISIAEGEDGEPVKIINNLSGSNSATSRMSEDRSSNEYTDLAFYDEVGISREVFERKSDSNSNSLIEIANNRISSKYTSSVRYINTGGVDNFHSKTGLSPIEYDWESESTSFTDRSDITISSTSGIKINYIDVKNKVILYERIITDNKTSYVCSASGGRGCTGFGTGPATECHDIGDSTEVINNCINGVIDPVVVGSTKIELHVIYDGADSIIRTRSYSEGVHAPSKRVDDTVSSGIDLPLGAGSGVTSQDIDGDITDNYDHYYEGLHDTFSLDPLSQNANSIVREIQVSAIGGNFVAVLKTLEETDYPAEDIIIFNGQEIDPESGSDTYNIPPFSNFRTSFVI